MANDVNKIVNLVSKIENSQLLAMELVQFGQYLGQGWKILEIHESTEGLESVAVKVQKKEDGKEKTAMFHFL